MTISKKIFGNTIFLLFSVFFGGISGTLSAQNRTVERIKSHLEYLGSDLFKGRGTGTTGGNLAAKYLAGEYSKYNLNPMGNDGTYYQYIPMHGSTPLPSTKLIILNNEDKDSLILGNDYIMAKSGSELVINEPLEMVFVGYGIIANEYDYNDYFSVNVEGKIVVMFEGEPYSNDVNFFDAQNETVYSNLEAKERIALSRGAKGCIFIPSPQNNSAAYWEMLKRTYSFENISLAYSVNSSLSLIINPSIAEKLFFNSKFPFDQLIKIYNEKKILSFPLQSKFLFKGDFKRRDFLAPNIIGMIEGSDDDYKDKYIIISAHYDHLGIGYPVNGDSIYNGVSDNAAGVSALLELAKSLSESETKPKYSILFLLVTGEEMGLLGSGYYTSHPVVPLYKTIANVNIDGIASFDTFKSIVGIGAEFSSLQNTLEISAVKNNLTVSKIPSIFMTTEAFRSSDQISFALAGIPSILIMEALDYEHITYQEGLEKFIKYSTEIYHTPFDDLSQPINFDAFIQHLNFLKTFIITLSNEDTPPEWNNGVHYNIERLRTKAEKR